MKVKIKQCISGADCYYLPGEIADFDESTARAYAAMDVVEIIEEQQAIAPAPTRTADKPGRKKSES